MNNIFSMLFVIITQASGIVLVMLLNLKAIVILGKRTDSNKALFSQQEKALIALFAFSFILYLVISR
ncbi:MAG: hypothetical protein KGH77_05345 [Candidatus Micrarchaeota archaeon]|nr:hypothetical protein [Candidatus Micrarchaeota archaeon]